MKQHICLVGSLILIACFVYPAGAVTLETVLQTSLERNPDIQQAKSGLEQAAGKRLVFRSVAWPDVELGVPAGVQMGHRAGESGVKGFAVVRGALTQTLFNASLPASLRRGDVEVLIAQQQLNVAVVEQLHTARLAFYTALYNRSLESIRREQQRRLDENAATQRTRYEAGLADKSALTSATVQASELDTQIESAHRAYRDAQLQLALAMGIDPAKAPLPEPEGELQSTPMPVDVDSETAAALQRRADLKLARLFVRAANEDQRIIEADYYPAVIGSLPGEYVPVTGIHREGSTSKTQDFIGSEIREKATYTKRTNVPETGDEYPSRTLADRERSQDNRDSRKIPRLRNGRSGGKRARGAAKSGKRSGVPTRIPGYSKFPSGDQKRIVGCHLSAQSRHGRMGPRHGSLFSIFERHRQIAVNTAVTNMPGL